MHRPRWCRHPLCRLRRLPVRRLPTGAPHLRSATLARRICFPMGSDCSALPSRPLQPASGQAAGTRRTLVWLTLLTPGPHPPSALGVLLRRRRQRRRSTWDQPLRCRRRGSTLPSAPDVGCVTPGARRRGAVLSSRVVRRGLPRRTQSTRAAMTAAAANRMMTVMWTMPRLIPSARGLQRATCPHPGGLPSAPVAGEPKCVAVATWNRVSRPVKRRRCAQFVQTLSAGTIVLSTLPGAARAAWGVCLFCLH